MSTAAVEPSPALPDYLTDPNAVLKDKAQWRFGRAPDYTNTRKVFEQTKRTTHETLSLPSLVQNLVKNWEIEASFKTQLSDWRTVDHANYSFAVNGGPPQTGEHMLKVGTYNAIIAEPNEFYSPRTSDFATSHKTFKRMMPTFAWEVLEVYAGPPQVAFRWRHWGEMKKDYVGFNDKGEKITAKAHGGLIDIQGVTIATVNEKVQLQRVETWFDPLEMFRQIAPKGVFNKEVVPLGSTTSKDETREEMAPAKGTADSATTTSQQTASDDPPAPNELTSISPAITSEQTHSPKPIDPSIRLDEMRSLIRQILAEDYPSLNQHTNTKASNDLPSNDSLQAPLTASSTPPVNPQLDKAPQAQAGMNTPSIAGGCPFLAGAAPTTDAARDGFPVGAALASAPDSAETKEAKEELGTIKIEEREGYMNAE